MIPTYKDSADNTITDWTIYDGYETSKCDIATEWEDSIDAGAAYLSMGTAIVAAAVALAL